MNKTAELGIEMDVNFENTMRAFNRMEVNLRGVSQEEDPLLHNSLCGIMTDYDQNHQKYKRDLMHKIITAYENYHGDNREAFLALMRFIGNPANEATVLFVLPDLQVSYGFGQRQMLEQAINVLSPENIHFLELEPMERAKRSISAECIFMLRFKIDISRKDTIETPAFTPNDVLNVMEDMKPKVSAVTRTHIN